MSLQESPNSVTGIKYVKVDSPTDTERVNLWAVVETDTGRERGFVASTEQPYESNSPHPYIPVKWGAAFRKDEFHRMNFPYEARAHASMSLLKKK